MKFLITIARIVVGLLFIFSGLVKANDPHGLSYKMQEFFEIWGVHHFNSWTLWLSILMNAFEIIAGFALLLGWRIRLFIWLLLLLILFFTFLTGYIYVTGKPANCGCFGDCIPITSKTSFLKDVVLTVLISFLFRQHRKIKPLFTGKMNNITMLLVIVFSFGIQWYTLNYLPVIDCLPYKKGNNINQQMQMPANAIPDSTVITFVYKKDGKDVEFTADQFPADFNTPPYEFVKRYDKIVRKGSNNTPPIKGFSLTGVTNQDSTQFVLSQPYAILLFCEDFTVSVSVWKKDFEKLYTEAKAKNIPVFVITRQFDEAQQKLGAASFKDIIIFKCDFTAIRTAARTNPAVYLLENGTVRNKQSYRRIGKITEDLGRIAVQPVILPTAIDTLQSQDTTSQQPVTSNQ